jgi:hypothetical protein
MIIKDALKFTYSLLWQHWTWWLLLNNTFLYSYYSALSYIYWFQWYLWSWMHTKDAFSNMTTDILKLNTRWPVHKVDRFWTSTYKEVDWVATPCSCEDLTDDCRCSCDCECECADNCVSLRLKQIQPNNRLCVWEYQISWSNVIWMWWLDWTIIKTRLTCNADMLRVSYYRWPKPPTSFDETVPLPDSFMYILWTIIACQLVPQYGIMMQWQEINRYTVVDKMLEWLKKADNRFPKDVQLSPDYPYESPKNYTPWFSTGFQVLNP